MITICANYLVAVYVNNKTSYLVFMYLFPARFVKLR